MTRGGLAVMTCLAAALSATAGPPEVSVEGLEVRIAADGSPLELLLAELSEATGMEVIYEASPPSISVTAQLRAQSPAEAVIRLLDGLAVSYALQLDASGERVTRLWIAGKGSGTRKRPRAAPARPERRRPQAQAPVADDEERDDPVEAQPDAGTPAPPSPDRPFAVPRAFPTPLRLPPPPPPGPTPTPVSQG